MMMTMMWISPRKGHRIVMSLVRVLLSPVGCEIDDNIYRFQFVLMYILQSKESLYNGTCQGIGLVIVYTILERIVFTTRPSANFSS